MSSLAIAISGWDPSAGAGAAADLKTFAAWGVYGQAVITSLTVQNSRSVLVTDHVPAGHLRQALAALEDDNGFDAVKVGMLGTADTVRVVAEFAGRHRGVPLVLDPVVRSTSGRELLDAEGLAVLREQLLPMAAWVTPNLAELGALTGRAVHSAAQVEAAAAELAGLAPGCIVLVTGGHLDRPDDFLLRAGDSAGVWVPGTRVETSATHGTGCTLASSIAAMVARWPGAGPEEMVRAGKRYIEGAMRHAPGVGKGHGPMQHFWRAVPERLG